MQPSQPSAPSQPTSLDASKTGWQDYVPSEGTLKKWLPELKGNKSNSLFANLFGYEDKPQDVPLWKRLFGSAYASNSHRPKDGEFTFRQAVEGLMPSYRDQVQQWNEREIQSMGKPLIRYQGGKEPKNPNDASALEQYAAYRLMSDIHERNPGKPLTDELIQEYIDDADTPRDDPGWKAAVKALRWKQKDAPRFGFGGDAESDWLTAADSLELSVPGLDNFIRKSHNYDDMLDGIPPRNRAATADDWDILEDSLQGDDDEEFRVKNLWRQKYGLRPLKPISHAKPKQKELAMWGDEMIMRHKPKGHVISLADESILKSISAAPELISAWKRAHGGNDPEEALRLYNVWRKSYGISPIATKRY
jgi:hypothetical protein